MDSLNNAAEAASWWSWTWSLPWPAPLAPAVTSSAAPFVLIACVVLFVMVSLLALVMGAKIMRVFAYWFFRTILMVVLIESWIIARENPVQRLTSMCHGVDHVLGINQLTRQCHGIVKLVVFAIGKTSQS